MMQVPELELYLLGVIAAAKLVLRNLLTAVFDHICLLRFVPRPHGENGELVMNPFHVHVAVTVIDWSCRIMMFFVSTTVSFGETLKEVRRLLGRRVARRMLLLMEGLVVIGDATGPGRVGGDNERRQVDQIEEQ